MRPESPRCPAVWHDDGYEIRCTREPHGLELYHRGVLEWNEMPGADKPDADAKVVAARCPDGTFLVGTRRAIRLTGSDCVEVHPERLNEAADGQVSAVHVARTGQSRVRKIRRDTDPVLGMPVRLADAFGRGLLTPVDLDGAADRLDHWQQDRATAARVFRHELARHYLDPGGDFEQLVEWILNLSRKAGQADRLAIRVQQLDPALIHIDSILETP